MIAKEIIRQNHYTHSVPSGKSHYFQFEDAIVVFSIPANKNIARFLGVSVVWELSRLWAPDGHRPDLLTQAISSAVKWLLKKEPNIDALISYADPNAGHKGGIYRAASWIYLGQCEESRNYTKDGQTFARRKFHSGSRGMTKAEIESLGYMEIRLPGKHRFVRPISKTAKRAFL